MRPRRALAGWLARVNVASALRREALTCPLLRTPSRGAMSLRDELRVLPGPTKLSRYVPGSRSAGRVSVFRNAPGARLVDRRRALPPVDDRSSTRSGPAWVELPVRVSEPLSLLRR